MDKTIYNLELHEFLDTDGMSICRVPGGWIYRFWDYIKKDYNDSNVFVPYNNEFISHHLNIEFPEIEVRSEDDVTKEGD